jgi:hypothetical protein
MPVLSRFPVWAPQGVDSWRFPGGVVDEAAPGPKVIAERRAKA